MPRIPLALAEWTDTEDVQAILNYHNRLVGTDFIEKRLLLETARDGAGNGFLLEIGADKGQSLLALASGSKLAGREKVLSIDMDLGRRDLFWERDARIQSGPARWSLLLENLVLSGVDDWVILIGADSMEAWQFLQCSLRVLYVDGNHDYPHTANDILRYGAMLVSGGWIFVHDYWEGGIRDEGTFRAVNELIRNSPEYRNFQTIGILAFAQKQ